MSTGSHVGLTMRIALLTAMDGFDSSEGVIVVAATNRDLQRGVSEGWFREDLYFRLGAFIITVPPLRERRSEIPPIINYYINHYSSKFAGGARLCLCTVQRHAQLALGVGQSWQRNARRRKRLGVLGRVQDADGVGMQLRRDLAVRPGGKHRDVPIGHGRIALGGFRDRGGADEETDDAEPGPVVQAALDRGLLINRTSDTVIRLLPPYTITAKEFDAGIAMKHASRPQPSVESFDTRR